MGRDLAGTEGQIRKPQPVDPFLDFVYRYRSILRRRTDVAVKPTSRLQNTGWWVVHLWVEGFLKSSLSNGILVCPDANR